MGQEQSQSRNGRSAQTPPVATKTCYYEVLGVERQASDDEIKKAYRRKALELHPDRNYGDVENATIAFAEVSTAYEVLSDPQERAWYDSHRDSILRGDSGPGDAEEQERERNAHVTSTRDIVNLISRFNPGVPFTDAPNGFYGILRTTFQTLAVEEASAATWEGLEVPEYPDFGDAKADYEEEVRIFYKVWINFSTKKTFSWRDQYRTSDAPDRPTRRFLDKENKKFRDAGIREFNEAVVALVTFVRRRDPRYIPNSQTDAQRQKILRDAAVTQAKRARAANQAKLNAHIVPEWAIPTVRAPEEGDFDEEDDEVVEHIECVACGKVFKSEKQYEAHERSKKHIKTVQHMQREMRKENKRLGLSDEDSGLQAKNIENPDILIESEPDDGHESNVTSNNSGTDETTQRPSESIDKSLPSTSETSDIDDEYAPREEVEVRLTASLPSLVPLPTPTSDNDEHGVEEPKLGKAKAKRAKKAAKQQSEFSGGDEEDFKCAACNESFVSKTKLFHHIKENPKHAQPMTKLGKGKKRR